ncbi:BRO family protein [Metabacillus fastidiosus]|uniref:BRO family protein n=1 Tax=Metabacillus fastidiosus TaxID=1458 RepID=UPI003D2D5770
MDQLQKLFEFQGQQLRMVVHNDEPWFVAKDVCNILELTNPTVAMQRLEEDERAKFNLGRQGSTNIINESGLYELIFASRKLEAKMFKKWVKQEVLPSIRKNGAYMTPDTIEKALTSPDFLIRLATNLKEEQEARKLAEDRLEKQQPLVSFAQTCMASEKSLLVREVAKLATKQGVIIGEKRLYQKLREWKLIFINKNEPYQKYLNNGYFEITQGVKENAGGTHAWLTMRITPKGQAYIFDRLKKENERAIS